MACGYQADVAIVGARLGGVAAALAACENGASVVMIEPNDWIGGQLTAQGVPPDEHPWIETCGCTGTYRRFRNKVREYYRRNYPLTAAARKEFHLNPGNGFVSRLCHEPRVAMAVLQEIIAAHQSSGRLTLLLQTKVVKAEVDGAHVRAIQVEGRDGTQSAIQAGCFPDASDLGDLLELTGTEFVTGFESQRETGEPHAPTTARPLKQQAFTFCFAMDYLPGEDCTIGKPAEYEIWRRYVPAIKPAWPGRLFSWWHSHHQTHQPVEYGIDPIREARGEARGGWLYRRIADRSNFLPGTHPADICLVNWALNDYLLGPLVGVRKSEAETHMARARQLSLSLLYWLQTESPRADGGAGWAGLRLRKDVLGTADGLAKQPYIRESRRIRAVRTIVENHVSRDLRISQTRLPYAERFSDSVGIGSYHMDLHPS